MSHEPATASADARTIAADRQAYIKELVHREGSVTVDRLVQVLNVSRMTVHRDLDTLEAEHVLRKVRGGATAARSSLFESDWPFRATTNQAEKEAIGRVAAEFIEGGMAVLVDESTTALTALQQVDVAEPLTVITNCYPAIAYVTTQTSHRLIALGGDYIARYQAFLGMISELAIRNLYADVLLASCSAIRGQAIFHQDQQIVGAKKSMLSAAPTRILLADHTKFDVGAIYHLGRISEFTHLITDERVDPAVVARIEEEGVQVKVAPL